MFGASIAGLAVALVACSDDTTARDQARIEASYRNPANDARAQCLGEAVVRRAKAAGLDVGALADRIAEVDATDTPHYDQTQARVIADALLDCPLPAPAVDAATSTTSPASSSNASPASSSTSTPTSSP